MLDSPGEGLLAPGKEALECQGGLYFAEGPQGALDVDFQGFAHIGVSQVDSGKESPSLENGL